MIIELTLEEYNAVIEARQELNELFGFGKNKDDSTSSFNAAKNNAVNNLKSTSNEIDQEKRRREELRQKLLAAKQKTA